MNFREAFNANARFFTEKDASGNDVSKVELDIATVDTVNKNGRYYSRAVYENANKDGTEKIKEGKLWGLLEHPSWDEPRTGLSERIILKYTKLSIKGDIVKGEAEIVETSLGKDFKAIAQSGIQLGVSTNGYGSSAYVKASSLNLEGIDPNMYIEVIGEDYTYDTIDVVTNPSNSGGIVRKVEGESMFKTLEELKIQNPSLYTQLMREANSSNTSGADSTQLKSLEDTVAKLTAKLAESEQRAAKIERQSIVSSALVEAKLPKLKKQGDVDPNALFEKRLMKIAAEASSLEDAKERIADEIADRKALLQPFSEKTDEEGDEDEDDEGSSGAKRGKGVELKEGRGKPKKPALVGLGRAGLR